jgi:hypothetical protein
MVRSLRELLQRILNRPRPYADVARDLMTSVLENRAPIGAGASDDMEHLENQQEDEEDHSRDLMNLPLAAVRDGHRDRLVSEVLKRIDNKRERCGVDALLPPEHGIHAALWLELEVNNGGFHQYFLNSAGDDASTAIVWLHKIGALRVAEILDQAIARFPGGAVPMDRRERIALLSRMPLSAFDDLNDVFYDLPYYTVDASIGEWLADHIDELDLPPSDS